MAVVAISSTTYRIKGLDEKLEGQGIIITDIANTLINNRRGMYEVALSYLANSKYVDPLTKVLLKVTGHCYIPALARYIHLIEKESQLFDTIEKYINKKLLETYKYYIQKGYTLRIVTREYIRILKPLLKYLKEIHNIDAKVWFASPSIIPLRRKDKLYFYTTLRNLLFSNSLAGKGNSILIIVVDDEFKEIRKVVGTQSCICVVSPQEIIKYKNLF